MALLGRDNHEDLNYPEETQPLTGHSQGEESAELNVGASVSGDSLASPSSPTPSLSHIIDIQREKEENEEKSRVLHSEVEKMFQLAPKFDISSLSSGSSARVSEHAKDDHAIPLGETRLYREEDYTRLTFKNLSSVNLTALLDTESDMGHRRDSFPHIHHPLKALRSKSSKSLYSEKPKKKKKKKKKWKMHTTKSFPSRSAALSPPIPEVEVEEYEVSPPGSSSSSLSDDDFDEVDMPSVNPFDIVKPEDVKPSPEQVVPKISIEPPKPDHPQDIKVGFYIGDREMSPSREVPKFTIGSKSTLSSDTWNQGGGEPATLSVPSLYDNEGRRYSDFSDEPLLSPSASGTGSCVLRMGQDAGSKSKVKFSVGEDYQEAATEPETAAPEIQGSKSEPRLHRHRHRKGHHDHYKQEDLLLRRQIGSDVKMESLIERDPTEMEEAHLLHRADLDEMASHRFENVRGIRRHKIAKHNAMASIVHIGKADKSEKKRKTKFDHSPHEVFVELDELYLGENKDLEWREKARWIKFEEDVEEGAERWGKPHVASLSFHSLLELRRGLENGTMLLDLEGADLPSIVNSVIDSMIIHDQLKPENKGNLLRTLLLKHRHVGDRQNPLLRRSRSYMNLMGLDSASKNRHQRDKLSLIKSLSSASFKTIPSETSLAQLERQMSEGDKLAENSNGKPKKIEAKNLQFVKVDVDNNMQTDGVHIGIQTTETNQKHIQDIMRRIPLGSEAITVLVGCVDYLDHPTMAFVRLAEGQILENLTEVPLPVRFIFILLGPETPNMDYHEVGRSISTLMSNQQFHDVAYKAETRAELLHAINEFLDESIVLPPGEWDEKTLLPIAEMNKKRARMRRRKKQKEEEKQALLYKEKSKIPSDPLKRTGRLFGGLINDIRRRYPHYASDFKDAANPQCFAAFIFIFFACFAPCIAFGGLLGEKTEGYMGVTETVISTSISGIVFGLFAGQPLMIVGATGPVLVFEQSLFKFCKNYHIEFLTMRVWIGFWVMMISAVVVAVESSFLVRYITRFTEEIFAILISLIFIFEVIKKLQKTFDEHPLVSVSDYCADTFGNNQSSPWSNQTIYNITTDSSRTSFRNASDITIHRDMYSEDKSRHPPPQPNTALLTTILTLGTFLIAHFLRIFRNSKFLGRSARRALGDFGIVISIILMVLLDYSISDIYTQKLEISDSFEPTSPKKRGWFIHPLGTKAPIETYVVFASVIPASLIVILLFLETQITEMILCKKEGKLKKGSGYHLDQLLMGIMTFVCALFGLPWMCAATVRTIAHVSALSVMSKTHAPGEKPKLLEVKEQRVTNIFMNAMIGVALMWGPLLRAVPIAVLFGVFLYLGVQSLSGVQMYKRIKLLLIPVKHHPSVGFVRRVRTLKMHLYTIIQGILLILLLIIKMTVLAQGFPLFVILLIPLRHKLLGYIFSNAELKELDKEEEDIDYAEEDDPDFYQLAHMPV